MGLPLTIFGSALMFKSEFFLVGVCIAVFGVILAGLGK